MKEKKVSRTARMFELVLEGLTNEAAVAVIKKEYGKNVPTNSNSIGWCRTQLKAKTDYAKKHNPRNLKVISNREAELKAKGAKKSPEANKAAIKAAIQKAQAKSSAARAA